MIALPAPVTLFAAGLATSVGPCVAPRFLAAVTFASDDRNGAGTRRVAALFCGIVSGYVALGAFSSSVAYVARYSTVVYALLACLFVVLGVRGLFLPNHECAHRQAEKSSNGGAFLLGLSSVAVISPCCAPVIGAIGVMSFADQSTAQSCFFAACFAVGHALPVLLAGWSLRFAGVFTGLARAQDAVRVGGATLTVALGGYFALLV